MNTIFKLLIVDNQTILREGVTLLLSSEPDLEIVAQADHVRDLEKLIRSHNPDLILLGADVLGANNKRAIEKIREVSASARIILLTDRIAERQLGITLNAGADGYVLKDDTREELLAGVRVVLSGERHISSGISNRTNSRELAAEIDQDLPTPSWEQLTPREREVLELVAKHFKNREIAGTLSLSYKTVEKHRASVMKKLELHSASEITAYAMQNGLVKF